MELANGTLVQAKGSRYYVMGVLHQQGKVISEEGMDPSSRSANVQEEKCAIRRVIAPILHGELLLGLEMAKSQTDERTWRSGVTLPRPTSVRTCVCGSLLKIGEG